MCPAPSDAPATAAPRRRRIRSFVRREGRLTPAQARALDAGLPRFGVTGADLQSPERLFDDHQPITAEIGFGDGENLLDTARAHPDRNYLGFEVHRPGVGRLLDGVAKAGLTNVRVCPEDAAEGLTACPVAGWLDAVYVLFPDPWHKARHHKRRLIQPDFLDVLARLLRPGGHLRLATDWADYAEHMLTVCDAHPAFVNDHGRGGVMAAAHDRIQTKFERRGLRLGHHVTDLAYRRV